MAVKRHMLPQSTKIVGVRDPRFLYGTAWKENETQRLTELALQMGFRGIDTANQRRHYHEAAVGQAISASIERPATETPRSWRRFPAREIRVSGVNRHPNSRPAKQSLHSTLRIHITRNTHRLPIGTVVQVRSFHFRTHTRFDRDIEQQTGSLLIDN